MNHSLSALATYSISYLSLRASTKRPMTTLAFSGAVLTVTSLKGPLRVDMVVYECGGVWEDSLKQRSLMFFAKTMVWDGLSRTSERESRESDLYTRREHVFEEGLFGLANGEVGQSSEDIG